MNKLKLLELSRLDLSDFNIFILFVGNTICKIYCSLHCCFCVQPWLLIFSELYDPYPINNRNSLKVHKAFDYQILHIWLSHQVSVNFCKFSGEEGTLRFNLKTYVPSLSICCARKKGLISYSSGPHIIHKASLAIFGPVRLRELYSLYSTQNALFFRPWSNTKH